MPTRRKTLGGGLGILALLGGVVLFDSEDESNIDPDDDNAEGDPELDSEPKPESESEPGSEPGSGSESEQEPDPDEGDVRFNTVVEFPDDDQRVSETVTFDVTVENDGNASGEYTVNIELDRTDPDTDHGNTWTLSGELDPDSIETHVAEYRYWATGTYELRVDTETVRVFEVLNSGNSHSGDTSDGPEESDDDPTITVGGHATVNATEDSAS